MTSKFNVGDKVRFKFWSNDPAESVVQKVEVLTSHTVVWVTDPNDADDPYPCYEHECEVVS